MILEYGNMWDIWGKTDLFLITTNSEIKSNGRLVMGRGLAKQALDRFPDIDRLFGNQLLHLNERWRYHILINELEGHQVGAFQVKYHFKAKADLNLIVESTGELVKAIAWHSFKRVDLNFPGIGNGGLSREEVLPVVSLLPDVVHIWEQG